MGRFSTATSASLRPPEIGFNESNWTLLPVTSPDDFLLSHIKDNFHLIPELPLAAKKPWLSERTLRLISRFQNTTFTDCAPLKAARKAIKQSARNDKKLFIAQNLVNDFQGSSVHQWDHTRQIRSKFKPRAAGLYDTHGKLVSSSQRAKTFADYLADKVWHSAADPSVPVNNPYPPVPEIDTPFTMHDLDMALRRLKPRKPQRYPG